MYTKRWNIKKNNAMLWNAGIKLTRYFTFLIYIVLYYYCNVHWKCLTLIKKWAIRRWWNKINGDYYSRQKGWNEQTICQLLILELTCYYIPRWRKMTLLFLLFPLLLFYIIFLLFLSSIYVELRNNILNNLETVFWISEKSFLFELIRKIYFHIIIILILIPLCFILHEKLCPGSHQTEIINILIAG